MTCILWRVLRASFTRLQANRAGKERHEEVSIGVKGALLWFLCSLVGGDDCDRGGMRGAVY